jgi:PAS domain S-box-containing protein
MTESDTDHSAATLRRLAEKRAQRLLADAGAFSPEETRRVLHELRVHQIELEIQNEELRRVQAELETARARYFDLYDVAPVGYCTVSEQGLILEANLAGAELLGTVRSELIKEPLTRFILKEDQDIYYLHRKRLFETGTPQGCELRLKRADNSQLWARLDATVAEEVNSPPVCRLVMIDITDRKQIELSLLKSQMFLNDVIEQSPYATWIADEHGTLLRLNRACRELLRITDEEVVGKYNVLQDNLVEQQGLMPLVRSVFAEKKPVRFEIDYDTSRVQGLQLAGASKVVLEVTMFPICDANGTLTNAVIQHMDITERKRAEEALKASETSLASIFRAAPIGIGLVSNRILKQVNDQMCTLVGYTREELVGNSSRMVYPSDEEFEFVGREKYRQIREQGTGTVETRWRRKDGVIIDVLLSSTPVDPDDPAAGVTFTALDVTERVQAEKTLRESEEKWRSLAESSPDHIMNLDQDGKIRFINFTVNDLTAEGVLERPIYDFIPENYRGEVKACLERVRKTGRPDSYATEYKHSDGTMLYFSSTVGPILLDGKVIGFTVSSRDVTLAKQAEVVLQKAHDDLELRVKQRTLELSKVNRDLKKQIQVREKTEKKLREHQQELQTLASELSLAEERERRRFAENLHDTISQSLVMAHMKLESLTVDTLPGEVSDSIRQINQMVGHALENTQTLTFELSPPVLHRLGLGPAVESLADRLHSLHGLKVELVDHGPAEPLAENIGVLLFRAIRELLINVIKHAGMRTAKVTITADSSNVVVDVEDQGAGFDPSAQKDRPRREGFGLLNIQERLTHLGGSCTIQSKPGKGTRITLSVPVVTAGKIAEGKYV